MPAVMKIPVKAMLAKEDLAVYYRFFEAVGITDFDETQRLGDLQVEQILDKVERENGIEFSDEIHVRLWRVFRYAWHRSPKLSRPFRERTEVPEIDLPEPEWKHQDAKVKYAEIEADRQRQIVRKTVRVTNDKTGKVDVSVKQFEVFEREPDVVYMFQDVKRCVEEWERLNPRTMAKEDSREEVMKSKIRAVIERCTSIVAERKQKKLKISRLAQVMQIAQVLFFLAAALMVYLSWFVHQRSPSQLAFAFVTSSTQFLSGMMFFVTSIFAYAGASRRKIDLLTNMLKKVAISCERLTEQLSDFRVTTNAARMTAAEAKSVTVAPPSSGASRKGTKNSEGSARRRGSRERTKSKEEKKAAPKMSDDKALGIWVSEIPKRKREIKEQMALIHKGIGASYRKLPEVEVDPKNFKRTGGDRMVDLWRKIGGVQEQDLVIAANVSREQPALEREGGFSPPAMQSIAGVPSLPAVSRPSSSSA